MPANLRLNLPPTSVTGTTSAQIALALLLVYVVWGTTYLALGHVVQHMPVLSQNALRFIAAGLLMLAWAKSRGQAWPTMQQWRNSALVGGLMACVAMSLVSLAQRHGIGSGLMATVVTTMPMWLALWTHAGGERVGPSAWIGLALGVCGAALLALERDFSATPLGAICAFGAPLAWSLGSYASRKLPQPPPAMASGAQWLSGGLLAFAIALAFEQPSAMWLAPAGAWLAWAYLLAFGTMLALSAYLWLLQHTSPALAGSYAFVNPAVALAVGVLIGGEHLSGWVWLALPLIFAALALILKPK
jgi:drug/metabolite transporter (DMT)-like permease